MPNHLHTKSIAMTVLWAVVVLIDVSIGIPLAADLLVIVLAALSLMVLWIKPNWFSFNTTMRIIFIPIFAWASFIPYALLATKLRDVMPDNYYFVIRPFISLPGLIASSVISLCVTVIAQIAFKRDAWAVCVSGVGIAAILSIKLQWGPKLFPIWVIADSLSLVVFTGLIMLASMLITPNTSFHPSGLDPL